jgi:hypothetical protein
MSNYKTQQTRKKILIAATVAVTIYLLWKNRETLKKKFQVRP